MGDTFVIPETSFTLEFLGRVCDLGRTSSNPFLSISMYMDPIHLDMRNKS